MASLNPNAPYGFRAIRNRNGDFPIVATRTASASISFPEGAIAYQRTDGLVGLYDGTATTPLGARPLLGSIMTAVGTTQVDRTIVISEDPNTEYEVMLDDGSVTGVNGLIGRNFVGIAMTSRSVLNQSQAKIDASTGSSLAAFTGTNIRPFQAVRFAGEVGNISSQSFARVIVRIRPEYHLYGTSAKAV